MFCEITASRENAILALDWQHPSYRIHDVKLDWLNLPHDDWPITPFPDGDYYIFLTETFSHGFLGHPWEQTICVFGEEFVDLSLTQRPDMFQNHHPRQPVIPDLTQSGKQGFLFEIQAFGFRNFERVLGGSDREPRRFKCAVIHFGDGIDCDQMRDRFFRGKP